MEAVIRQLQHTATVMAGIQARPAAARKGHSEWLEQHEKSMAESDKRLKQIEQNLLAITKKLDALKHRKNGETR